MSRHGGRSPIVYCLVTLFLATAPCLGQVPTWELYYYDQPVALTLDDMRLAVYEASAAAAGKAGAEKTVKALRAAGRIAPPGKSLFAGSMGNGWTLADLSGTPSAGDPEAILGDVNAIAEDPTTDAYATVTFLDGEAVLIVGPEILVAFEEGVSQIEIDAKLAAAGAGAILEAHRNGVTNYFLVAGGSRSGIDVLATANALAQDPDVIYASPDWIRTGDSMTRAQVEYPPPSALAPAAGTPHRPRTPFKDAPAPLCGPLGVPLPDDPELTQSWGLESFNDVDVDANGAWEVCTGGPEVIAAVIDDGTQLDHPDLPNVLPGADFTDECTAPPCDASPKSNCSNHGTAVAGVLAAAVNNGLGSAGVAPHVTILPVRAGRYWLWGETCVALMRDSWLEDAIDYSVANGARLTSLSWNFTKTVSAPISSAYRRAYGANVVNLNSAGNANEANVAFPGTLSEVLSISGINQLGELFFVTEVFASNWGADVFVTAPGQGIFTTDRVGDAGYEGTLSFFGGDFTSLTGTSFACPFAAGIVALILAKNPSLGPEEVAFILAATAKDLGSLGRDEFFGYGICNAEGSVIVAPDVIMIDGFERGNLSSKWQVVTE